MNLRRSAAWLLGIGFGGTVVVVMCILGYFAGPAMEAYFFPPVKAELVAGSVEVSRENLCWETHFKRTRAGLVPAYFNYRMYYDGEVIPLSVYRVTASGKRSYLASYGFAVHTKDEEWISRYCVDMPHEVPMSASFFVEGDGSYISWHHLWQIKVNLPGFVVNN